jgi:Icc-related predicted phosphoesterase
MNILAVSDIELNIIYNPSIKERFRHIDLMISCGDLPYYYMEYMISSLDRMLYYVRGNHVPTIYDTGGEARIDPWGGIDVHRQVVRDESGLLLAGFEGSLRYNRGKYQYSQAEMWLFTARMLPKLLSNRLRYGRAMDVLVTHAPPWKIHDQDDLPHQGIRAFRWLIQVFQPALHLHGHIHLYQSNLRQETRIGRTLVANVYGFRELEAYPRK